MRNRALASVTVVIGALVLLAAPAFAHIHVEPGEAEQGSTATFAFEVPTERDVSTVKVDVKFPDDHPIANVTVTPKDGWTVDVKRSGDHVTEIIWAGGEIKPDASESFEVTAGPLPSDVDEIGFPTIQTYADGVEVAWIEETPAGGAEPEHPVPVLKLLPSTATATTGGTTATTAPTHSHDDGGGSNTGPIVAAVVAGLIVLAVIVWFALRRRRGSVPA